LHRGKELALERCRLVQEEEQGLSKTVEFLKQKCEKLSESSLEIRTELGPLEASVKDKTKQVRISYRIVSFARSMRCYCCRWSRRAVFIDAIRHCSVLRILSSRINLAFLVNSYSFSYRCSFNMPSCWELVTRFSS
jgi:hypothetical protein